MQIHILTEDEQKLNKKIIVKQSAILLKRFYSNRIMQMHIITEDL